MYVSFFGVKQKFQFKGGRAAYDPACVKTRSVMLVDGVTGDAGWIMRPGATNSAESIREDA